MNKIERIIYGALLAITWGAAVVGAAILIAQFILGVKVI